MNSGRIAAASRALKEELKYVDDIQQARQTSFNIAAAVLRAVEQYDADHALPLAEGLS